MRNLLSKKYVNYCLTILFVAMLLVCNGTSVKADDDDDDYVTSDWLQDFGGRFGEYYDTSDGQTKPAYIITGYGGEKSSITIDSHVTTSKGRNYPVVVSSLGLNSETHVREVKFVNGVKVIPNINWPIDEGYSYSADGIVRGNVDTVETIDFSGADTSCARNMMYMFKNLRGLTTLDISNFKTSNVTSMRSMFEGCSRMQTINLTGVDTSKVTTMESMFADCVSLQSLDLSGLNTSNVTNMGMMFWDCRNLQTLNLTGINTSNVTDMHYMFYVDVDDSKNYATYSKLTSLDLSSFNTSKVTNMKSMFCGQGNLTSLNLSSFDTSNVKYMDSMFTYCRSMTHLNLSNFNVSKAQTMQDYTSLGQHYTNVKDVGLSNLVFASIDTPVISGSGWVYTLLETVDIRAGQKPIYRLDDNKDGKPDNETNYYDSLRIDGISHRYLLVGYYDSNDNTHHYYNNANQGGNQQEHNNTNDGQQDKNPAPDSQQEAATDDQTKKPVSPSEEEKKETVDKKQAKTSVSKVKAGKKSFTVSWKKQTAKGIKGYEIQYSMDKKFKKDVKIVTIGKTKTTSKKIKKLKSGETYYIRVRTYKKANSKKVYSKWSKAKSITVK
ncbi:BspA family leucine-rich repeat surface protein [Butyrivibrio sp. WCD3002]|uniref:BspA family leucine-rich repeat surface protein n=1 Tax=Butyrivibrio sp. WCD3002 TaxID=1280676 RepID=UPI0004283A82|nr:BspA family leucine-rich repeat surface protein [Butyrivibrio sp. WCD3002]